MASPLAIRALACCALLGVFAACGSPGDDVAGETTSAAEPIAEATSQEIVGMDATVPNTPPRITELRVEPEAPVAGDDVRVFVKVADLEEDPIRVRYAWTLDGKTTGANTPRLTLGDDATRDGVIEVTAVASDGRADSDPASAAVRVGNRPPVIANLLVEPAGTLTLGVDVELAFDAHDPDGDEIAYETTWRVNDETLFDAETRTLATKNLKNGDRISASVRATDGIDYSRAVELPELTIANLPPRVVSRPGSADPGARFDYQIEVEDPDATRPATFELAQGPEGMAVDATSGLVTWQPSADQSGAHAVRVIVDDGQGARVAHDFEVRIVQPGPAAGDS